MADTRRGQPTAARGPELAWETCFRRLQPFASPSPGPLPFDLEISWHGPAAEGLGTRGSEPEVQALSGLMEVHGWDTGRPRRLGLEVASVAAGLLAANGALAAVIGAWRDRPVAGLETSVLQAGLWLVSHHIAAATSNGELLPSPPGPEAGPPFRSADGAWFEIEVFDADAWKAFWQQLGAGDADLGRAWTAFRSRYYRGRCSLPAGLHQATASHSLARVSLVAAACDVSIMALRSYTEVLADVGGSGREQRASDPWAGGGLSSESTAGADRAPVLPLEGLRVVEATNRMQGPLAGLLLQMLGADVTRVEPPGGDVGRMVPPACGDVGSFFLCYNRGKRCVELDLTRPAGQRDLLDRLAETDVFLHNWRPGRAIQWGLDQPRVAAANPRMVYAEATGWGESKLNAQVIGTDFLVQAYAAFGEGLNPVGEAPLTSRALLTDCLGALVTCEGVLGGLLTREATGRGAYAVTSLLDGAMAAQAHVLHALVTGHDGGRRMGRPVWGPLDRPLPADGDWVVVGGQGSDDYERMFEICGINTTTTRSPGTAANAFLACVAQSSPRHWEKIFREAGIPCAAARVDLAALPGDPHVGPLLEPLGGSCHAPAAPWRFHW